MRMGRTVLPGPGVKTRARYVETPWVRTRLGWLGAGLVLLLLAPSAALAAPAPAPPPADLAGLTAELATVTAHAQLLAGRLDAASARGGGLRVALERLEQQQRGAQLRLDVRARAVYMAAGADPLGDWQRAMAQPDLRELARRGEAAALTVDRALVQAVSRQSSGLVGLRRQVAAQRAALLGQARQVLADQDRARALLSAATTAVQAEQLAAAQRADARRARLAALLAEQLQSRQAGLDAASATVTLALTPTQSARTRAAAASQAGVVALLEAAGSALPGGYAPSGRQLGGTASWYGPGFVGRPTASGAPYDPERLTCANKQVPLGTVLRVSANGRTVSCLVNDRGPYVGDRVLDMSRAGSRALGYDGLAQVVIEVLVPV